MDLEEVANAEAVAGSASPTTKDAVTSKIISFLSEKLEPTDDGGYHKTLSQLFRAAWSDPEKHAAFKHKLDNWERLLRLHQHAPLSNEHIVHVPAGAVREFYISPWQLSFDADASVKGLMAPKCPEHRDSVPVSGST